MNIAELARQFPNWRNPEQQPQPPPSQRPMIGPWRKNGRKVKPTVDDKLLARRERKRKWYYNHKGTVLAKLKQKRDATKIGSPTQPACMNVVIQ